MRMGQGAMPGRWGKTVTISTCLCRYAPNEGSVKYPYAVVGIYSGNAPAIAGIVLPDSLAGPLLRSIIEVPSVYLELRGRRLICKGIKLFNSTNFACPLFQRIVYIACLCVTSEVEADKGKVSAAQTDRRGLSRNRRNCAECAERYYRVCDPEFSWSDGGSLRLC